MKANDWTKKKKWTHTREYDEILYGIKREKNLTAPKEAAFPCEAY